MTLRAIETKILGLEEINIEERTSLTGYGGVNMSQGANQLNEQGMDKLLKNVITFVKSSLFLE